MYGGVYCAFLLFYGCDGDLVEVHRQCEKCTTAQLQNVSAALSKSDVYTTFNLKRFFT